MSALLTSSASSVKNPPLSFRFSSSLSSSSVTNFIRTLSLSSLLLLIFFTSLSTSYAVTTPIITKVGVSNTNVVSNGLVGYWTFDGKNMTSATATDSSGNSNNGTLMNGPTKVIGKIGQGISFDGVDDYITAPSISAYNTAGNFSVSVWIKPPNQNQNSGTILNQRLGSYPFTQWALYIGGTDCINGSTGKKIQIDLLENSTTLLRCLYTTNDIVDGKWHHLVLVSNRTNATTTLYVDGVSTSLTTFTSVGAYPNTDTSQPIVMGQNNGGSHYYTGLMDDVKYYNRAISAKEVLALYKAGGGVVIASVSNTKANTNATGISDGLIGHWTFDGKNMTSTTAIDSSGNGNTGTLTNMTASSSAITGKIGQGLLFNGSSYISFLHTATLNAYPISFGGWFKTTLDSGLRAGFISKYTGGSGNGWEAGIINKKVYAFYYGATSSAGNPSGSTNFNDGKWHHNMNVVDASGIKVYVDGTIIATSSWSGTPSVTTSISVGRIAEANLNSNFPGSLDDVRIYNRALSSNEVQALYKSGGVTIKPSSSFTCGTSNVTDADGNIYNTVAIGAQCWMKQNMRVGTRIGVSTAQSNNSTIEKYCYSDTDANCTSNDPNQPDGGLYRWDEAMQYSTTAGAKGICPTGWHIPTHDQLTTMERNICTSGSCTTDFPYDTSTTGYRGTNEGTKLQPGGSSGMEVNLAGSSFSGSFFNRGSYGVLWSSSESGANAWDRSVKSGSAQVNRGTDAKSFGFSVRCLKD